MKKGDLVKVININTIDKQFYEAENCLHETATVIEEVFYDAEHGWMCAIEFDNSDLQCFQGVNVKLKDTVPVNKEDVVLDFIQSYTGIELKLHQQKLIKEYLKDMYE